MRHEPHLVLHALKVAGKGAHIRLDIPEELQDENRLTLRPHLKDFEVKNASDFDMNLVVTDVEGLALQYPGRLHLLVPTF
jgi:hypothetical protein